MDLPPPTTVEMQQVAHYLLDTFAEALGPGSGGRVLIGPTKKVGHTSYAFVRVSGQDPYRFKLTVTAIPDFTGDGVSDYYTRLDSAPRKEYK